MTSRENWARGNFCGSGGEDSDREGLAGASERVGLPGSGRGVSGVVVHHPGGSVEAALVQLRGERAEVVRL